MLPQESYKLFHRPNVQTDPLPGFAGKPGGIRQNDLFLLPSSRPILGADVF
jgi:hypothetical protein